MADEQPQQQEPKSEKKEKKARTPICYVAFVWTGGAFKPLVVEAKPLDEKGRPNFREFEGYKRTDVLDELIEFGFVESVEDSHGQDQTPWVLIVPASKAGMVRGTVETKRSIKTEE